MSDQLSVDPQRELAESTEGLLEDAFRHGVRYRRPHIASRSTAGFHDRPNEGTLNAIRSP